jgi:head-tail adaptor
MIGELRHRITIQRKGRVSDGAGGAETEPWSNLATVWAQIDALSAYQTAQSEMVQNRRTHKITVRASAIASLNLDGNERALFKTRVFVFKSAPRDPEERGVYLEIQSEEGAPT